MSVPAADYPWTSILEAKTEYNIHDPSLNRGFENRAWRECLRSEKRLFDENLQQPELVVCRFFFFVFYWPGYRLSAKQVLKWRSVCYRLLLGVLYSAVPFWVKSVEILYELSGVVLVFFVCKKKIVLEAFYLIYFWNMNVYWYFL